MDKQQTWIGFLATVLIVSVLFIAALREPARMLDTAAEQQAVAIEAATDLYAENCVVCHGASGEGLGAYPALAAVSDMDADTLFKTIERGRFGTLMAAYGEHEGGIFTEGQIDTLVTLIQYGDWGDVYTRVESLDLLPPEMVVAEIPDETITMIRELSDGDTLASGLLLYAENCTSCHGANAEGTTLAPALNTTELRDRLTDADIARIVEQGVPGTLMASWGNALADTEITQLVSVIRRWDELEAANVSIPVIEAEPVEITAATVQEGSKLFNIMCASCHGSSGYGTVMAPALNNELFLTQTSDAAIKQIISMGVTGTKMPAWGGRLTESDINMLIAYIRSWDPNTTIITEPQ